MFGHTRNVSFWGWYPQGPLYDRGQMRWGHNLLLFLVSLKSSPWQWQGFQQDDRHNDSIFWNFLSPKWLCYKSSLTHPKCTKSHLQRSRFQKIFLGEKPPDSRFWGSRFVAGEGVGRNGEGIEGEGKAEGMWRGLESGLPRSPRWLSAGLSAGEITCKSTTVHVYVTYTLQCPVQCRKCNRLPAMLASSQTTI